jgi:hypothetical protein
MSNKNLKGPKGKYFLFYPVHLKAGCSRRGATGALEARHLGTSKLLIFQLATSAQVPALLPACF